MQRKLKYYQILGIHPTEDQRVIKKAYRRLALRYHPDRNKSNDAHFRFIEITRAYEILSGQVELPSQSVYRPKTKEEVFAEKVQMAKERYRQQMEEEARKDAAYYQRVAFGWKWGLFKCVAIYTFVFTLLLIVDYFSWGELRTIPPEEASYGILGHTVGVEKEVFHVEMEDFWRGAYGTVPFYGTYSFLFHDLRKINLIDDVLDDRGNGHSSRMMKYDLFEKYKLYSVTSSGSVYGAFPILHMVLLVPFLLIVYKRPTLRFNIWRLVSIWIIFPVILFLTFSNDRIYYLLGILEY